MISRIFAFNPSKSADLTTNASAPQHSEKKQKVVVRDESYGFNGGYVTVKKIEIIDNQIFCDVIADISNIHKVEDNPILLRYYFYITRVKFLFRTSSAESHFLNQVS